MPPLAAHVELLSASLGTLAEHQASKLASRLHEKHVFNENHQKHTVKPPFRQVAPTEGAQRAPQGAIRGHTKLARHPKGAPNEPHGAPRGPGAPQRSPKEPHEAPREVPKEPHRALGRHSMLSKQFITNAGYSKCIRKSFLHNICLWQNASWPLASGLWPLARSRRDARSVNN